MVDHFKVLAFRRISALVEPLPLKALPSHAVPRSGSAAADLAPKQLAIA